MERVNILNCKNDEEFRNWLVNNHSSQRECWVNCKKGKPKKNVFSYNTSGANETILVKFNCLNSRAIAPKIRVPFGFPS